MNIALCKRHFVFFAAVLAFLFFLALHPVYALTSVKSNETFDSDAAPSLITDDEIESFLFRVNEVVRNKVMMLGGSPIECLPTPLLFGVSVGDVTDTWGEARAGGRVHDGTDILVPRGELVVSPTEAVVTKIGSDNRGGNFVVTANPGGEQFYFAHLDSAAENLSIGDMLGPGDLIGYVGNTGNARGKLPHLHLGIYYKGVAQNPFPRLLCEFSIEEKIAALEQILYSNKIELHANNGAVRFLQRFLITASTGSHRDVLARTGATGYFGMLTKNALAEYQQAVHISPAIGYFGSATKASILTVLHRDSASIAQTSGESLEIIPETEVPFSLVVQIRNDLEIGSMGKDVEWLQDFLISADTGPHAKRLANESATGYFGTLTKNALAEYQLAIGIKPASGYFGSLTRASIQTLGGN